LRRAIADAGPGPQLLMAASHKTPREGRLELSPLSTIAEPADRKPSSSTRVSRPKGDDHSPGAPKGPMLKEGGTVNPGDD
jgi:hypothetical protein